MWEVTSRKKTLPLRGQHHVFVVSWSVAVFKSGLLDVLFILFFVSDGLCVHSSLRQFE